MIPLNSDGVLEVLLFLWNHIAGALFPFPTFWGYREGTLCTIEDGIGLNRYVKKSYTLLAVPKA